MTRIPSIALLAVLVFAAVHASAAPEAEDALQLQKRDALQLQKLLAEVGAADGKIKESMPELNYAIKEHQIFRPVTTIHLRSAEGRDFTVLILDCPSLAMPGEGFMLVYLRDPAGALVDWKSQWLYNRNGVLESKVLDLNQDGVQDFCFVSSQPSRRPEQFLAAFCVRKDKFEPVIAEHTVRFSIEFQETELKDGVVIQPQLKGPYSWQSDKLYEIPVKLRNRSQKPVDLRGRSVWLSPKFYGTGYHGQLGGDLQPGAVVDSVITVRFTGVRAEQKFGFEITPREGP